MRIVIILCISIFLLAPATAQADWIDFHPIVNGSPQPGGDCIFADSSVPGIRQLAVVLHTNANATGARFAISQSGTNWQLFSITSSYTAIGGALDFAVGFGACIPDPIVVATVTYYSSGHSPCGPINIDAPYGFATPVITNCEYRELSVQTSSLWINGAQLYYPEVYEYRCGCPTVATAPSTWGKVKSLYRD